MFFVKEKKKTLKNIVGSKMFCHVEGDSEKSSLKLLTTLAQAQQRKPGHTEHTCLLSGLWRSRGDSPARGGPSPKQTLPGITFASSLGLLPCCKGHFAHIFQKENKTARGGGGGSAVTDS